MKIMPSLAALVTATSIGIATGHAWSNETTPGGYAVPAVQTPAPDRYRTLPRREGYAQRWQQPSRWPARPSGYGQMRPYYPPQRQYQAVPAAPANNPVSTESKQTQEQLTEKNPVSPESKRTQEQLTAKSTELDRAQVTLEQLQLKLQHSREAERAQNEKVAAITGEQQALQTQVAKLQADLLATKQALQQAQSGNTLSSEQLGTAMAQADTLKNLLTELKTRLESQQTMLQQAEMQTAPQAVQQAAQQELPETTASEQQAQPETTRSKQQPKAVGSEVAMLHSLLSELKIQLENANIRLQDSAEQLAACRQDQTRAKQ